MTPYYTPHETIYFYNALGWVVYHPAGYVRIDWEPLPMAGTAFRELLEQALALLVRKQSRRLYTDHRGMPPIWVDECTWLVQDWFPRTADQLPGCRVALVEDTHTLSGQGLQHSIAQVNELPLDVVCFKADETALSWLQQKQ